MSAELEPAEDHVWLGDLSGFTVEVDGPGPVAEAPLTLVHRCGWRRELHPADAYLANIIVATREHPPACLVHVPHPDSFAARIRERNR